MSITKDMLEGYLELTKTIFEAMELSAIIFATDCQQCTDIRMAGNLSYPNLKHGRSISEFDLIQQALLSGKAKSGELPGNELGTTIVMSVYPFASSGEEEQIAGCLGIIGAKRHWPEIDALESFGRLVGNEFAQGASLLVMDTEKLLKRYDSDNYEAPGTGKGMQIGDKLSSSGAAISAINTNKKITRLIPAEIYGIPVKSIAVPVTDNKGTVIGAMAMTLNRGMATDLQNVIYTSGQNLSEINSAIVSVANSAATTAQDSRELNEKMQHLAELITKIDDILMNVKNISEQTNMLGLNAAIEAARAGENGRGFSVVAEEVRKLSGESKSTVIEIKALMVHMSDDIEILRNKAQNSMQATEEQAAAIEEITASLQEIAAMMQTVEKVAVLL